MEGDTIDIILQLLKGIPVYPREYHIWDIAIRIGLPPKDCMRAYRLIPGDYPVCEDDDGRLCYPDQAAKKISLDRCYASRTRTRKRSRA